MACTAFQISEDDIETVLRRHSLRVSDTQGKSFSEIAEKLIYDIDHERVELAAMSASCKLEEQTEAAHEEIKIICLELGVLS